MVKPPAPEAATAASWAEQGIREHEANLRNKIGRGSFTGVFLLQCLVAMGIPTLHLEV